MLLLATQVKIILFCFLQVVSKTLPNLVVEFKQMKEECGKKKKGMLLVSLHCHSRH